MGETLKTTLETARLLLRPFDASDFACRIAGEVKGFALEEYISAKEARHMDSFIHYGLAAAIQADAGEEFNVNSTPQLRTILFEKLGLTPSKKTKTGASTDAATLYRRQPPGTSSGRESPMVKAAAREASRERILRAAVQALATHGYAGTTARTIALKAGALAKVAAGVLGGGGGGRDDVAQGGGADASALPAALDAVSSALGAV